MRASWLEVLWVSLRLGLTSFGGPIAHLGYFREEYVARRRWLSDRAYADLVALCQFLPGPASSQVGIGIGYLRAGFWGSVSAWIGFTLPSAAMLVAFAATTANFDVLNAGWLHGLKIAAVAVVAYAVWGMAKDLAPDRPRATIAVIAVITLLAWPTTASQLLVIAIAGLAGWLVWKRILPQKTIAGPGPEQLRVAVTPAAGFAILATFFALIFALPVIRQISGNTYLAVADSFYRTGSLVFGGGHVVLPLIQAEVVPAGWVTQDQFVAGYGAAQAVPGPLFSLTAYLGAVMDPAPNFGMAALALVAIYVPSFLLVLGALPFWAGLRTNASAMAALMGINAAVVGILAAALYNPIWTSAVLSPLDFGIAAGLFVLLAIWRTPPLIVVALAAIGGQMVSWTT